MAQGEPRKPTIDASVDPSNAIDPAEAGEPERWDYVTDEVSTTIDEAYPVQASATLNGQAVEAEFHVAMEDGTFRWFTDCGAPAG